MLIAGASLLLPAWDPAKLPEGDRELGLEHASDLAELGEAERVVTIREVCVEPREAGFRPDARVVLAAEIGFAGGFCVDVEVYRSNRVSRAKRWRMRRAGRYVVEIDVSDKLLFSDDPAGAIRQAVLSRPDNRRWVSHPLAEARYRRVMLGRSSPLRPPGGPSGAPPPGPASSPATDNPLPRMQDLRPSPRTLAQNARGELVSVALQPDLEVVRSWLPDSHPCGVTNSMLAVYRERRDRTSSLWAAVGLLLTQLSRTNGIVDVVSCASCLQVRPRSESRCVCGCASEEPIAPAPHQLFIWASHPRIAFACSALERLVAFEVLPCDVRPVDSSKHRYENASLPQIPLARMTAQVEDDSWVLASRFAANL